MSGIQQPECLRQGQTLVGLRDLYSRLNECTVINIGNRAPEVPRIGGDVTTRRGKVRPGSRQDLSGRCRTHGVVVTAPAEGGRVASIRSTNPTPFLMIGYLPRGFLAMINISGGS
jgi:hypothetical protein